MIDTAMSVMEIRLAEEGNNSSFEEDDDDDDDDDDVYRNLIDSSSPFDLVSPIEDRYYQTSGVRIDIPPSTAILETNNNATKKYKYPRELRKTLLAFLFMTCNFIATTASLAIIHEQRPLYEPLPDQILDRVPRFAWALNASEIILQVITVTTVLVIVFHKHRVIILRRIFFIAGLLYGYRAITMFVTVLPSANPAYHCAPKLAESGQVLTFGEIVKRVFKILSGFGLSINGQHVYCGDFIYSGHTMMAVLCYLIIVEYTAPSWYLFRLFVWFLSLTAVIMLMLARGHYSIDVVAAYFVTTRLFWTYHSLAYRGDRDGDPLGRLWWRGILVYFEKNVRSGPVPYAFSCPSFWVFRRAWRAARNRMFPSKANVKFVKRLKTTINNIKSREIG